MFITVACNYIIHIVASYSMAWSPYIWPGTFGDLWLKAQQGNYGYCDHDDTKNLYEVYIYI